MKKQMTVENQKMNKAPALGSNPSRLKSKFIEFKKSEDGVAAIEFAFVGPIFFALLFSIIDVAAFFMMERATEAGADQVSRKIRTNVIASSISASKLREELCNAPTMALFNCDSIHVDVRVVSQFGAPGGMPTEEDGTLKSDDFVVNIGNSREIHIVRVYVPWPSILPWGDMFAIFSQRPSASVDTQRVIGAATAFLKE